MDVGDRMDELVDQAKRQTSALETIRGILLFFVAVTIVAVLSFIAAYANS